MPNWCQNSVTITATSDILEAINEACAKGELFKFIQPYEEWDYGTFVETFGSKWEPNIADVSIDNDTQQILIIMDTAWSPPTGAYDLLLEMEGVEDVNANFCEPGMDFVGTYYDGFEESMEISYIAQKIKDDETLSEVEEDLYAFCEGEVDYLIEMWAEEEENNEEE